MINNSANYVIHLLYFRVNIEVILIDDFNILEFHSELLKNQLYSQNKQGMVI